MSRRYFYPPLMPTLLVARRSGMLSPRTAVLSTLPGRLLWSLYLRRRVPTRMLHARKARARVTARATSAKPFRAVVVVAVAPGERPGLLELVDSIRCYEGDRVKVVVADDLTGEYGPDVSSTDFPGVDFVQPRVPSGSGYCAFRTLQVAILHALRNYEAPVVLKVDPDSLLIASGSIDEAQARFAADRELGILGTTEVNARGEVTDYRWADWMAHPELRWSRRFRRLVGAARAGVPNLGFAQAGAYFARRDALAAALRRGVLPYRQPHWSLQVDDVIVGLVVQAAGYRVRSFGAPGDPIASDTDRLPLEPADLAAEGFKVVHSVHGSPNGLTEHEVREFFRARRSKPAAAA